MEQPFNILFQGNIKTKKESSSTSSTACHDYGHQQINFLQFKPEDLKPSSCRLDFERLTQLNQLHIQRCLDVEQKTLELAVQLRQLLATSPKFSCYADTISQEDIVHILQESKGRINSLCDLLGPSLEFLWNPPHETDDIGQLSPECCKCNVSYPFFEPPCHASTVLLHMYSVTSVTV